MPTLLAILVLALAGCVDRSLDPAQGAPTGQVDVFGYGDEPLDFLIGQNRQATTFSALRDGDDLELLFPPAGGSVSYVGVRVTNISDDVAIRAELFASSGERVAYEERTITLTPVDGLPGFGGSDQRDTSSFANLPLCPDFLSQDIVGEPHRLDVTVLDRETDRTRTKSVMVTPRCADPEPELRALCECWCRADYRLGRCQREG